VSAINVVDGNLLMTSNISFINGSIQIYCGVKLEHESYTLPRFLILTGKKGEYGLHKFYETDGETEEECNSYLPVEASLEILENTLGKYLQNVTNTDCIYDREIVGQREIILQIHHPNLLIMRMFYDCQAAFVADGYTRFKTSYQNTSTMFTGLSWQPKSKISPVLDLNKTSLILKCPISNNDTNIFQWGVSKLPHTPIIPTRLIQMSKTSTERDLPSLNNTNYSKNPNIKIQEGELFKRNSLQIRDNNNNSNTMCFASTKYARVLYPIETKENCFKLLSFAYSRNNQMDMNPYSFYNLTYLLHNEILDFNGQSIEGDEFLIPLNRSEVNNFLFSLPSLFYMRSILINPLTSLTDTDGQNYTDVPLYIHSTIDIYKDFMTYLITWTKQHETLKIKWAKTLITVNINNVSLDLLLEYECNGKILLIISNDSRCTFSNNNWFPKIEPLFQNTNYSVRGIFGRFDVLMKLPYDSIFNNNMTISFCSWQKYLCFEDSITDHSKTTIQLIEPNPWEMEGKYYENLYKGVDNKWTVSVDYRERHPFIDREIVKFLKQLIQMHNYLKNHNHISGIIPISNYLDENNVCPCRTPLTDLFENDYIPRLSLSPGHFNPMDRFYCNLFYDTNSNKPLYLWEALEEFMCVKNENYNNTNVRTRISNYQPKPYLEIVSINLTHNSYICRNVFSQCMELEPHIYFNFDNTTQITVFKNLSIPRVIGLSNDNLMVLPLPLNYSIAPYEFNHMLVVPNKDFKKVNCQHMMQKSITKNVTTKIPTTIFSCRPQDIKANIYKQCIICSVNISSSSAAYCYRPNSIFPKYSQILDSNLSCTKDPNIYYLDNILTNQTVIEKPIRQSSGKRLHFYCNQDHQNKIYVAVLCAEKYTDNIISSLLHNNSKCGTKHSNINLTNELQIYEPHCLPLPLSIYPTTFIDKFNKTHFSIQCLLPQWMPLPVCEKKSITLTLYSQSTNTSKQLIGNKINNMCSVYPADEKISCTVNHNKNNKILFTVYVTRESDFWSRIFNTHLTDIQIQCLANKDQLLPWKTAYLSFNKTFDDLPSTAANTTTTILPFEYFNFSENKKYIYLVLSSLYLIIICIPVIIFMYIIKTIQNIKIKNTLEYSTLN
jgi:hypothetical protein